MEPSRSERDLLASIVAARREALAFSRTLERERRLEQRRRAHAARAERERIGGRLLAAAGIDRDELLALARRDAERARSFAERQRRAIAAHAAEVARRREATPPRVYAGWRPPPPDPRAHEQLVFRSIVALDTVTMVQASEPLSYPDLQFSVEVPPARQGHNVVKPRAYEQNHVERGFHIEGVPLTFDVDLLFAWRADADVVLNAITFVQPNGEYYAGCSWAPFADCTATLDYATSFDLFVQNPLGTGFTTDHADGDHGLDEYVHTGWYDFVGAVAHGAYGDQSTLLESNFLGVSAGSLVVFDVSIALTVFTDGDASALLDFQSGDYEIVVPGVYAPTFQRAS